MGDSCKVEKQGVLVLKVVCEALLEESRWMIRCGRRREGPGEPGRGSRSRKYWQGLS